jgi:hypothetical protein
MATAAENAASDRRNAALIKDLSEWNEDKKREQLLSFRDKVNKYPRIVAGKKHALLDESNCAELTIILDAKGIRNSIVHPSAQRYRPVLSVKVPE